MPPKRKKQRTGAQTTQQVYDPNLRPAFTEEEDLFNTLNNVDQEAYMILAAQFRQRQWYRYASRAHFITDRWENATREDRQEWRRQARANLGLPEGGDEDEEDVEEEDEDGEDGNGEAEDREGEEGADQDVGGQDVGGQGMGGSDVADQPAEDQEGEDRNGGVQIGGVSTGVQQGQPADPGDESDSSDGSFYTSLHVQELRRQPWAGRGWKYVQTLYTRSFKGATPPSAGEGGETECLDVYIRIDRDGLIRDRVVMKRYYAPPQDNGWGRRLVREGELHQKITDLNCPHIVKCRGTSRRDVQGRNGCYYHLYLDYAAGGDLSTVIEAHYTQQMPIPEHFLWYVLKCLLDALHVLQDGPQPSPDGALATDATQREYFRCTMCGINRRDHRRTREGENICIYERNDNSTPRRLQWKYCVGCRFEFLRPRFISNDQREYVACREGLHDDEAAGDEINQEQPRPPKPNTRGFYGGGENEAPPEWLAVHHIDIKPENIFLADWDTAYPSYYTVQLADFGLSFQVDPNILHMETVFDSNRCSCTFGWRAPEQFCDNQGPGQGAPYPYNPRSWPLDSRTDLYAIGLVMWELLNSSALSKEQRPAVRWAWERRDKHQSYAEYHRTTNDDARLGMRIGNIPSIYSVELVGLVQKCLLEYLHHKRPEVKELRQEIGEILARRNQLKRLHEEAARESDVYQDLLPDYRVYFRQEMFPPGSKAPKRKQREARRRIVRQGMDQQVQAVFDCFREIETHVWPNAADQMELLGSAVQALQLAPAAEEDTADMGGFFFIDSLMARIVHHVDADRRDEYPEPDADTITSEINFKSRSEHYCRATALSDLHKELQSLLNTTNARLRNAALFVDSMVSSGYNYLQLRLPNRADILPFEDQRPPILRGILEFIGCTREGQLWPDDPNAIPIRDLARGALETFTRHGRIDGAAVDPTSEAYNDMTLLLGPETQDAARHMVDTQIRTALMRLRRGARMLVMDELEPIQADDDETRRRILSDMDRYEQNLTRVLWDNFSVTADDVVFAE